MADRRLQVFHAVAKHLSFTKAAEALFMTQPAVTFQIRQLEEHFNTRLFDRAHGRISLTAAGHVALDYAERILGLSAELDTRLKEMSGQVAGPLLIGASTTIAEFLLPQVLGEFKARYPGRGAAPVRRQLGGGAGPRRRARARPGLHRGRLAPALAGHRRRAATTSCRWCARPSHPLAKLKSATPKALTEHAYISREPGSGTREVIDHYLQKSGVPPDSMQVVMELGSPEALKGLVATGLGFAIMSRATVIKETQLGQLVQVPLSPRLNRHLAVVYPKEKFHSRLVSGFVQFAKERLAALQSASNAVRPAA